MVNGYFKIFQFFFFIDDVYINGGVLLGGVNDEWKVDGFVSLFVELMYIGGQLFVVVYFSDGGVGKVVFLYQFFL